ncbi:hypothetical protein I6G56_29400 [Burkholderia humptydooensis]|uniref:Uncharacterized protein n=1 Tax=Burkholderia humptydooensis TaxID=430531 RepID=A0A7U4SUE5_9BURK|nr:MULTISPECIES: hypothetical protein [Burkholderia]AJY39518.1 hypothetical protein BW21_4255 [Burkholderia sp. 2002721687]ALX44768.1 hypothetical protein AQ610_19635 [Burkholderia humptydooensis]QPS46216.1 hypothetical protein I6G56_29400 [Burkholderia humptydooensis]
MNARQIHALIAASASNPQLIARWRQRPDLLRTAGIEPDQLDLRVLENFVGLSLKVRHNGLRGDFPLSFRLLSVTGLEIEVFAAYASNCAQSGHAFAATPRERARDLIAFLDRWLDPAQRNHALLWDILRHEYALSCLRQESAAPLPAAGLVIRYRARATGGSIPMLNGAVAQHVMHCDPERLAAVLRRKVPALDTVPAADTYCCYWRSAETGEIRFLRVDALGYFAIEAIDGRRSAADICDRLLGDRRLLPQFLRSLDQLAGIGLVRFERPPGSVAA